MKITKFVHSCLLLETPDKVAIIDPGQFSWQSKLLDISSLKKLDYIVITHEHQDHFFMNFVQALVAQFPEVCIVSTPSVMEQLSKEGIDHFKDCKSDEVVQALDWPHESMDPLMPGPSPCENIGVHFAGVLTHPGDSYKAIESKAIFAVPLAGPWGATIEGIRLAAKLKPKFVVPIHDWMWNDNWRASMYDRCEEYFETQGIKFLKLKDGEPVEISVA